MVAFYETVTKDLLCNLTEEERSARSMTLSAVVSQLKELKAANDVERKVMKQKEDRLQGQIASLADVVRERRETRQVPCKWEYDLRGPKDSIARLIRTDTSDIVEKRVLSPEEYDEVRQLDAFDKAHKVPSSIDNPTVPTADKLRTLLTKHEGNTTKAADEVGVSRRTFNRWLELREVAADDFRKQREVEA